MALAVYDRIQETTATTGTGTITLGGAVAGYQSFAAVGNGNNTYYTILDGTNWEVGVGTYSTTGPTLARTTVLSSSSGGSKITLSGNALVWCDYPASKAIYYDVSGVATIGSTLGYSDTGIVGSFASTVAGYNQVIVQNKSSATNASTNFNVSNDAATSTSGYVELGINSSTFSGTGSFNIAGASYLASASTDLAIGTYGAYNLHFVTNSSTTDAMTVFNSGGVSLGGQPDPGIGTLYANNVYLGFTTVTAAAGTTVLTNSSSGWLQVVGTTTQTIQLPVATTLYKGLAYTIANNSTGSVTIKDSASATIDTVVTGGTSVLVLTANGTSAGTWVAYSYLPASYDFSAATANFGGATITNATWNGSAISGSYGGTGLTTFTAANNALYSTGATTLTAGTLPIAAGGTGATSFSANYIPYVNGTNTALTSNIGLQFNGSYLIVGGTTPLSGATNPIAAFSSTANNYVQTYTYNANTGISGSADFVAYADNSTDTHGWADMGFTSSTYADTTYTVTGPNEAYILGSAPSGAGKTGNLVYATDNTGSANAHQWYVGGFTQAKSAWKMQLTSTGLQLANALAASYGGTGVTTLTGLAYGNGTSAFTAATGSQISSAIGATFVQNANFATTAGTASTTSTLTFNNGGTGGATGSTFNGASPLTVSYNTIGASPLAGSTSLTTLGTVTSGTWNAGVIGATYGGTGVAGTLTGISYMNGTAAYTVATGAQISSALGSTAISGQAGSVANALTINNSGTGSASGSTYNGSAAQTISYNSIGASPLAGSSSLTTTGTITSGTWNGSVVGVAYGGTGLTTTPANGALNIGNGTGFTRTTLTQGTGMTITNGSGSITVTNALPMVYPGAGIPNSTGSAWGTSYTTQGSGTVVALATAPTFTTSIDGGATFGAFASSTVLTIGYTGTGASSTLNIDTAALTGAFTKAINIGTGGTTSSTTAINIGSATSGTTTVRGALLIGAASASTTDGAIFATNNITAFAASDSKWKENIQEIPNALEVVTAIGSKTFDWTDEYIKSMGGEDNYFMRKSDFGVIAQDVQAVFPQAVRTRKDNTLAVDYEKLSTLAFAAIGQLLKRIEALEAK